MQIPKEIPILVIRSGFEQFNDDEIDEQEKITKIIWIDWENKQSL